MGEYFSLLVGVLAYWLLAGILAFRYVLTIPQIRKDLISFIRINHEVIVKRAAAREGITEEEARGRYVSFEQEKHIVRVLTYLFCILGPFSYILVAVARTRKNHSL